MHTLIIDRRGVSLDYEGQCLIVRHAGLPTRTVPMTRLQRIVCMHSVNLSTRVVGQCQHFGVDFIVLNGRSSDCSFAVHAQHQRQAHRRVAQYRLSVDPEAVFRVAQRLVQLKLARSLRVVRGDAGQAARTSLAMQADGIAKASCSAALRGHEGMAQRALFSWWREQLPPELGFKRRQRRPPPDPVNAVLSLAYTLAHHEAIRICLLNGLDPWLGCLHELAPGRQSLACDLIEPLRPALEQWVVQLFNTKQLEMRHFSNTAGHCLLGKVGREIFYEQWQIPLPRWRRHLQRWAAAFARHLDAQPGISVMDQAVP